MLLFSLSFYSTTASCLAKNVPADQSVEMFCTFHVNISRLSEASIKSRHATFPLLSTTTMNEWFVSQLVLKKKKKVLSNEVVCEKAWQWFSWQRESSLNLQHYFRALNYCFAPYLARLVWWMKATVFRKRL